MYIGLHSAEQGRIVDVTHLFSVALGKTGKLLALNYII